MKKLIALLLFIAMPLSAQQMDTTVHCRNCVLVDSTVSLDSVPKIDTTWVKLTRINYTYRDSLVIKPHVAAPFDTTGFKVLAHVVPLAQSDKGDGPVPLGVSGWKGMMLYDDVTAPLPSAIRWFYRDGCWGGVSPGEAWFEYGMARQNVTTVYTRQWMKVSYNWVGHPVGTKITFHGWGTNGSQQIMFLMGSSKSATGTLRLGWHWQGAGQLPTSAAVGGLSGLDPKGGNFAVPGGIFLRDKWNKVETMSHAAPNGTRGSWAKIWINDILVADVSGYDAARATNVPLSVYKLSPTWGGGTGCTASGGQNMWLGDIWVMGK